MNAQEDAKSSENHPYKLRVYIVTLFPIYEIFSLIVGFIAETNSLLNSSQACSPEGYTLYVSP